MSSTNHQEGKTKENIILRPSFKLPLIITILGIPLIILNPWPTIIISGFGLFLLLQSFTLRLEFTKNDLVVRQLNRELRRFPFKNWIAWRIFFIQFPVLLYFREEASPHLLPMLFNAKELENQLKLKVGKLEIKND